MNQKSFEVIEVSLKTMRTFGDHKSKNDINEALRKFYDLVHEKKELSERNRELTEILKPLVLRHNASEEFAILNNVEDQFCKAFNVDMVVVEKGWIEKVKKILEKCEGVE